MTFEAPVFTWKLPSCAMAVHLPSRSSKQLQSSSLEAKCRLQPSNPAHPKCGGARCCAVVAAFATCLQFQHIAFCFVFEAPLSPKRPLVLTAVRQLKALMRELSSSFSSYGSGSDSESDWRSCSSPKGPDSFASFLQQQRAPIGHTGGICHPKCMDRPTSSS